MAAPYRYPQSQQSGQYSQPAQYPHQQQPQQPQQYPYHQYPQATGYDYSNSQSYAQSHQQNYSAQASAYQSQHAQYQYPAHSYQTQPSQQYPSTPQSAYQYPPAVQSPHTPQVTQAQPQAQGCFNCGVPGHWAQDCPEPKREVPAGTLNPAQHKRHGIAHQKRNKPIVTKFGPAPQAASPSTYPPQSYSAGAYPQQPSPWTPSTPHSAHSLPSTYQWPQSAPAQHTHYQAYSHPQYPQGYPSQSQTPQTAYSTPTTPGPAHPYPPPSAHASPPPSQPGYDPQNPSAQLSQYELWQQSVPASQAASKTVPEQTNLPKSAKMSASEPSGVDNGGLIEDLEEGEAVEGEDEDEGDEEEDDLSRLDIPDFPSNSHNSEAIQPIAVPLPANSVVADTLSPFDRAKAEDDDCCRSKYWRSAAVDKLEQHIEDSPYWKDHKEDTIFLSITSTEEVVSFDECRNIVLERQQPESEQSSRRDSRSAPAGRDAAECAQTLQELERALAAAKAKQAAMMEKLERRKRQGDQRSPSQEQPLSAHNGSPSIKAEHTSPRQRFGPDRSASLQSDDADTVLASVGESDFAKPRSNGHGAAQMSTPKAEASGRHGSASRSNLNGLDQHPERQQLPPAPPHPDQRRSKPDHRSPSSGSVDPNIHRRSPSENGPPQFASQQDARPAPFRRPSDNSNNRKRVYESSSSESDTPRRQEDDFTPKHKRRQPKVADAYSRRW